MRQRQILAKKDERLLIDYTRSKMKPRFQIVTGAYSSLASKSLFVDELGLMASPVVRNKHPVGTIPATIEALNNSPDGQEILTALGQDTGSGLKKNVSSVSTHSQR